MSYPFCVNCQYYKDETVVNQNRLMHLHLCTNKEYGHVVLGGPVQAEQVRMEEKFCGLEARGFLEKAVEVEILEERDKKGVIITDGTRDNSANDSSASST